MKARQHLLASSGAGSKRDLATHQQLKLNKKAHRNKLDDSWKQSTSTETRIHPSPVISLTGLAGRPTEAPSRQSTLWLSLHCTQLHQYYT